MLFGNGKSILHAYVNVCMLECFLLTININILYQNQSVFSRHCLPLTINTKIIWIFFSDFLGLINPSLIIPKTLGRAVGMILEK